MRQICDTCGHRYDDERQWTICPHNPIEAGVNSGYCKRHDILGTTCYLCEAVKKSEEASCPS